MFSKALIGEVGALNTAWFRYATAFLTYVLFRSIQILMTKKSKVSSIAAPGFLIKNGSRRDWIYVFLMGVCTAFISPLTQMIGLTSSSATNNVILVSIEPTFTLVLAYFFLHEKLNFLQLRNLFIAFIGLIFFLEVHKLFQAEGGHWGVFWGDLLFCLAMLGEASFSVFGKKISGSHRPLPIFGTALFFGVALLSLLLLFSGNFTSGVPFFPSTKWGWIAVFWIGVLGSAFSYVFWLYCIEKGMPIAKLAMSVFIQPLVGSLAGMVIFGEQLHVMQYLGAGLLFFSVWSSIRA